MSRILELTWEPCPHPNLNYKIIHTVYEGYVIHCHAGELVGTLGPQVVTKSGRNLLVQAFCVHSIDGPIYEDSVHLCSVYGDKKCEGVEMAIDAEHALLFVQDRKKYDEALY